MGNTEFYSAEQLERSKFTELSYKVNQWHLKKIEPIGSYSPYDAIILSAGTTILSEVKVRRNSSKQYKNIILESNKVVTLQQLVAKYSHLYNYTGLSSYYFSFFSDSTVAAWPIDDFSHTGYEMLPRTTCGNTEKVKTAVCYYPVSAATFYYL